MNSLRRHQDASVYVRVNFSLCRLQRTVSASTIDECTTDRTFAVEQDLVVWHSFPETSECVQKMANLICRRARARNQRGGNEDEGKF